MPDSPACPIPLDQLTFCGEDAELLRQLVQRRKERRKENAKLMETHEAIEKVKDLERTLAARELLLSHLAADPITTQIQKRLEEARRRRNETDAWVEVAKRRRQQTAAENFRRSQGRQDRELPPRGSAQPRPPPPHRGEAQSMPAPWRRSSGIGAQRFASGQQRH